MEGLRLLIPSGRQFIKRAGDGDLGGCFFRAPLGRLCFAKPAK
jgi:hypothetical protein